MISDFYLDLNGFRIIRTIGRGQFAEVFLIQDNEDKQFVAKVNTIDEISKAEKEKAYMRETEVFSKTKYPTILRFVGYNLSGFPT